MKRKLKDNQKVFIELLQSKFGSVVSRKQILETAIAENATKIGDFLIRQKACRSAWGHYNLEGILAADSALVNSANQASVVAGNVSDGVVA